MITNERQYKITKSQLARLREGFEKFNIDAVAKEIGNKILAQAELDALRSEIEHLTRQLQEYETLRDGEVHKLEAGNLAELGMMLIEARIARHLTQNQLGEMIGVKEQQIQRYEAQRYASASLRRLLEIAKALGVDFRKIPEVALLDFDSFSWNRFPANDMYKRGWFANFTGSFKEFKRESDKLAKEYITSYIKDMSFPVLHRKSKRGGGKSDPFALIAWECRIRDLASKYKTKKEFEAEMLKEAWFDRLRKLSVYEDGAARAKLMLEEVGIRLIFEEQLPGTYVDGASFLLEDASPAIGMTLRYDRLDNFWFVLFHELVHIWKHLKPNELETVIDDFDPESDEGLADDVELEADTLSRDLLIPRIEWEHSVLQFIRSDDAVVAFANQIGVNPAVVAGRIRYDEGNFYLFSNLVGLGELRRQFSSNIAR